MARFDAMKEQWEKVELFGKECLFNDARIDKNTVPEEYFFYEIRHADEDWGDPCQLGKWIGVNFFGTLLSKEPFALIHSSQIDNAYLNFDSETDWNYTGEYVKLS